MATGCTKPTRRQAVRSPPTAAGARIIFPTSRSPLRTAGRSGSTTTSSRGNRSRSISCIPSARKSARSRPRAWCGLTSFSGSVPAATSSSIRSAWIRSATPRRCLRLTPQSTARSGSFSQASPTTSACWGKSSACCASATRLRTAIMRLNSCSATNPRGSGNATPRWTIRTFSLRAWPPSSAGERSRPTKATPTPALSWCQTGSACSRASAAAATPWARATAWAPTSEASRRGAPAPGLRAISPSPTRYSPRAIPLRPSCSSDIGKSACRTCAWPRAMSPTWSRSSGLTTRERPPPSSRAQLVVLDTHPRERHHGFGARGNAQRAVGGVGMLLHRVLRDAELARDLAVGKAFGHELQHVRLALGDAEVGKGGGDLEVRHRAQGLRRHVGPALQHRLQYISDDLRVRSLGQVAHRARVERGAHAVGILGRRDDQDAQARQHLEELDQRVDAAAARQHEIEQHQLQVLQLTCP